MSTVKITALLIRILICFIFSLIPLRDFENDIYSARLWARGDSSVEQNIIILTLDNEDFQALKPQRPKDRLESLRNLYFWDETLWGQALKTLNDLNPDLVLFTWHVPEGVVELLSRNNRELLPTQSPIIWSSQFDSDGKYFAPHDDLVANSRGYGFNNLFADSDGVVRRGILTQDGQNSIIATTTAQLKLKQSAKQNPDQTYLINYAGGANAFTTCRLFKVLAHSASPECSDLKGKILLLARDAVAPFEPLFRTPLGRMSRAEILANQIHTLTYNHRILRTPFWIESVLALIFIIATAYTIIYFPIVSSALIVVGVGLFLVIVSFQIIFQLFSVYIMATPMALAVLAAYLVFTGYRLAVQENTQWRSVKQAQYLRELDQMKSNFLSLVSHDLKTPIAKIQAVVERLRREGKFPAEALESIETSNNELKHYISSILNLSRIESQKVILNKKTNDINQVVRTVLRRVRSLSQQKSLTVEEELEPIFSFEFDEDLIRQVLTNLVDNAIKYSPTNSKIIVRTTEKEGFVEVEVEDFGPGIPKNQLPFMFRKFSRFLRPMKEHVKGTGLGLFLSKYFIELHGGTIRVQSIEGQGTTFSFSIPLRGAEGDSILS